MRVKRIGFLFVFIKLQIFLCSTTTTTTTDNNEAKTNNSLILKMITKFTEESVVKNVLDNLDVDVKYVLKTLAKSPDIMLTPLAFFIKWECDQYLQNTTSYCEWRPRSDEIKGNCQHSWSTGKLKMKVAICEIDPMISFCKMFPELPLPKNIHCASDFVQQELIAEWISDGIEAISSIPCYVVIGPQSHLLSRQSSSTCNNRIPTEANLDYTTEENLREDITDIPIQADPPGIHSGIGVFTITIVVLLVLIWMVYTVFYCDSRRKTCRGGWWWYNWYKGTRDSSSS